MSNSQKEKNPLVRIIRWFKAVNKVVKYHDKQIKILQSAIGESMTAANFAVQTAKQAKQGVVQVRYKIEQIELVTNNDITS